MLQRFYFYQNTSHDPHVTLALEEYILDHIKDDEIVLYLYSHKDTVVIGKNQNAWAECRHEALFEDGGALARRISGGGAVFHDVGNLNFSFVVGRKNYDLHRQLKVILDAVRSFGVHASFSGRNDILAEDRKFSGNAFCFRKNGAFHHGTILISADMGKLSKYLAVSKDKIESKGISSVRSRVVNLADLNAEITPDGMAQALKRSFEDEYGPTVPYPITPEVQASVRTLAQRNGEWSWLFGQSPKFDIVTKTRFPWGGVELLFSLRDGIVEHLQIFSDAMDAELISSLSPHLTGLSFRSPVLAEAIRAIPHTEEQGPLLADLADYMEAQAY